MSEKREQEVVAMIINIFGQFENRRFKSNK